MINQAETTPSEETIKHVREHRNKFGVNKYWHTLNTYMVEGHDGFVKWVETPDGGKYVKLPEYRGLPIIAEDPDAFVSKEEIDANWDHSLTDEEKNMSEDEFIKHLMK